MCIFRDLCNGHFGWHGRVQRVHGACLDGRRVGLGGFESKYGEIYGQQVYFRNGKKLNMCLFSKFPKNARSPNLHGSTRNACMCLYRPILSYIYIYIYIYIFALALGQTQDFLYPRSRGLGSRNIIYSNGYYTCIYTPQGGWST